MNKKQKLNPIKRQVLKTFHEEAIAYQILLEGIEDLDTALDLANNLILINQKYQAQLVEANKEIQSLYKLLGCDKKVQSV